MGQLRFLVPQPDRLSREAIETAYFCGREDLPWVGRVEFSDNELILEREENESGALNILWPVAGRPPMVLSSATLMERDEPYHLPLELARGTLNRLRNQLAAWDAAGMEISADVRQSVTESLKHFVQASALQQSAVEAAGPAEQSITAALRGIDRAAAAYVARVAATRQRQTTKTVPLCGGRLADGLPDANLGAAFVTAFNAAAIPFSWGQIERDEGRLNWSLPDAQIKWCQAQGFRICGGPLIEFQRRSLPDWLFLWEGDFDNLLSVASDHIRAVVSRYRGRVDFWNAAGRLITGEALGLNEEQKLRLVAQAIEVIRRTDPQAPVIASFDQPWAEFMSRRESDLPPFYFADTLVRGDLGLAGIGLEINLAVNLKGTLPRDKLEFNRELDRWASLGLPLLVLLTVPSAGGQFTPQFQHDWIREYLPLLMARQAVQAVFWNQLLDAETGDFPHTGLLDPEGRIKPSFAALAALRKEFSA